MEFITKAKVRIHYEVLGQGRPLVFFHGNGEDHHIFEETARLLAEEYTVYLPDSRCHGESEKTETVGYREIAADFLSLIQGLHLEKPVLCGFSDGGIVALLIAIAKPALPSALIVCGANSTPGGLKRRFRAFFRLQWKLTKNPLLGMMLKEPLISPAALAKIQAPTLVLAGSRDIIRQSHTEKLAAAIPGSRLGILFGETHASYVVHTEKLYGLLKNFLDELSALDNPEA